jgi:hypothetical protein
MSHSIEIWREIALAGYEAASAAVASGDELPTPQDASDLVIELSRRYPTLSRELAEYLAR